MKNVSKRIFYAAVGVFLLSAGGRFAKAETYATDFDSFSVGEVHGQDGWTSGHGSSFCPLYDVGVVANSYGYSGFGTKSLRISNAITCGSFNDHTFSKSLADEAGETAADTSAYSGGTRQPYFETQWDFASTVPGSEQVGLSVVASPDRGDPGRMAWLQMQDTPTGLQLNFQDYSHSILNFTVTPVATALSRSVTHTVKLTVLFVDGSGNDVVKIYVDGVLAYTGTTWEDYFRDFETGFPHAVDSMLFRVAGTAAPTNLGNGFLIDNFSTFSGPVPVAASPPSASRAGTITVIKKVVNDNGGSKTPADFPLFVNGLPVVSGITNTFQANGNVFSVTESGDPKYVAAFSGDCDANGNMNLIPGQNKFCTLTNDDVAQATSGSASSEPVKIAVTKTATRSSLPATGGPVTYAYAVSNAGVQPLSDISLTDDLCGPVQFSSGDLNANAVLEVGEIWNYFCNANLSATTTNTVTARGTANGVFSASSVSFTVVVAQATVSMAAYGIEQAQSSATAIDIDKGLFAPAMSTATRCADGMLMKLANDYDAGTQSDTTVYFCGADGGRYFFPDRGTFLSWYPDFSDVQTVSGAALAAMPLRGIVTYRPGSRMIKVTTDAKTYAVAKGGVLRWVTTEGVARLLYGTGWNALTADVDVSLFGSAYRYGDPIAEADVISGSVPPMVPVALPAACAASLAFTDLLQANIANQQILPMQRLLQCLGYFPSDVVPNGNFGPATLAAVKAFQSASGIAPLGYVGPGTRAALNRYVAQSSGL